jgi:type II secretion system protein J
MKMRRHNFRFRRHGFTLIELIVAMMMVAILAGSLYGVLRSSFVAKQNAETAVEPSRTAELAMEILRQDITQAIQPNPANLDTTTTPAGITGLIGNFEGTDGTSNNGRNNDDLVFFTTAESPQHVDANGEIKNIELTMIQPTNSNNYVLVRRVIRNLLTTVTPPPDTEVICRNISAFNVQYYDGAEWLDNWDSTAEDNTIPAAVAVTLELDRPANGGKGTQTFRYSRVFQLACSTAAFDSLVNPNLASASGSPSTGATP